MPVFPRYVVYVYDCTAGIEEVQPRQELNVRRALPFCFLEPLATLFEHIRVLLGWLLGLRLWLLVMGDRLALLVGQPPVDSCCLGGAVFLWIQLQMLYVGSWCVRRHSICVGCRMQLPP